MVLHIHCGALARMTLIHLLITADVTFCFLHLHILIFSPVCVWGEWRQSVGSGRDVRQVSNGKACLSPIHPIYMMWKRKKKSDIPL